MKIMQGFMKLWRGSGDPKGFTHISKKFSVPTVSTLILINGDKA